MLKPNTKHVCPRCKGLKVITVTRDEHSEKRICPSCRGTGVAADYHTK